MKKPITIAFLVILSLMYPSAALSQGLSIDLYPPVIQIEANPPSKPNAPIIIQNRNKEEVKLNIQVIPIKQGVNGDIELEPWLLKSNLYKYYQEKIQIIVDGYKSNIIELKPLEIKEISVNINLDKDSPPGDYYYSIVFLSEKEAQTTSNISNITAGIATNLLLTIGTKGETKGSISEFTTSFFKISGPVDFKLKMHNSSEHLILPSGNVTVKNIFGKELGKLQIKPQFVLAKGDRNFNTSWPEKNLFGLYKAEANITLSENGKVLTSTLYFFGFPVYLISSIVIMIFIVLGIYLRLKEKI